MPAESSPFPSQFTRGRRSKKDGIGMLQKRIDKLKEVNLHRFFIDLTGDSSLSSIEIDIKHSNRDNYKEWCDYCLYLKQIFPLICPVIQIEEDDNYENYLNGLARQILFMQQNFDYIMFRVDYNNHINIISDLKELISAYQIDTSKILYMFDCSFIRDDITNSDLIIEYCKVLASIGIHEAVISATSYPNSISEALGIVPSGKIQKEKLALKELNFYNNIKSNVRNINLIYSDYASVNPIRNDNVIMAKGWIPRIDLPYHNDILVYRKKRDTSSYAVRYKEIALELYYTKEFLEIKQRYNCWGVEEIEKTAKGVVSGANITFWISVRVNIYLTIKINEYGPNYFQ